MIDDGQWRDELLQALGREPTDDDMIAVKVAVGSAAQLRELERIAAAQPDGPMSDLHRELLRLSEARLAEAMRLLGIDRH